ncbi:MAG: 2-oxo-4-hydroxy-4-carboxy-5-ureidoimidazoline decarboxylase [Spirochaetaceae bacterium]|nr:2-oxo-4-hydroxy-4-carboxy-5-ureidoimidazoline decarboxylase [Spirochaetaceae bacterium]
MQATSLSIDAVNGLCEAEFVTRFGDVAEHSPWVAAAAFRARPFADRAALIAAFSAAVRSAAPDAQLALLRAHPDLANRAAIAGDDLAAESRREQAGAGLDRLTPAEFTRFGDLNTRYRERFGFPFIFAVRGATKEEILNAFEGRIANSAATERALALANVERILQFRLEDRVAS